MIWKTIGNERKNDISNSAQGTKAISVNQPGDDLLVRCRVCSVCAGNEELASFYPRWIILIVDRAQFRIPCYAAKVC